MPVEVGGLASVSKGILRHSARVRGCERPGSPLRPDRLSVYLRFVPGDMAATGRTGANLRRSRVGASEWAVLSSLWEVHAAKEVLEARIGAQRVEPRTYFKVEEEAPLEIRHPPGFIVE